MFDFINLKIYFQFYVFYYSEYIFCMTSNSNRLSLVFYVTCYCIKQVTSKENMRINCIQKYNQFLFS